MESEIGDSDTVAKMNVGCADAWCAAGGLAAKHEKSQTVLENTRRLG